MPKQVDKVEHRKALPYDQMQAFLAKLRASDAGLSTKLCLEFLILTATRSIEARGALWSEIDEAAKVWTLPAERMKMMRAHRIPLSPRALEIVRQAKGMSADLLFPGTKSGRPLSDMTLSKLVKELGFPVDVHGFRTSFRTWTQEKAHFPNEIAEAALAHVSGDAVERPYARSDVFEKRRKMMNAWAAYVAGPTVK